MNNTFRENKVDKVLLVPQVSLESKVQVDQEAQRVDVDLQALLVCLVLRVKRVELVLMVLLGRLVPLDPLDHLETEEHLVCLVLLAPLEQGVHKVLKANEEILEKLEKKVLLDHQDYLVPMDLQVLEENGEKKVLLVSLDHLALVDVLETKVLLVLLVLWDLPVVLVCLVLLVKLDPLDLLVSEEKEVKVDLLVLLDHLVCLANLDLQVCKVLPVKKERMALKVPKDIEV